MNKDELVEAVRTFLLRVDVGGISGDGITRGELGELRQAFAEAECQPPVPPAGHADAELEEMAAYAEQGIVYVQMKESYSSKELQQPILEVLKELRSRLTVGSSGKEK